MPAVPQAGYALVSGTGHILGWRSPDDGQPN